MKNYFLCICVLLTVAVSCKKVDNSSVFSKSADQRLNEALAKYQAKLSGAQYGWKGLVETNQGGNYTFYFSFNDSNRVKMLSSFDSASSVTLKESSYRLKALQQPSLLFDTYSYLHVLADPNGGVNGGEYGTGLASDFEFYFDDDHSSEDTIALVGRFNGSKTTLTRATQQEKDAFFNGELLKGLVINKILNYYKRIVINNTDSVDVFIQSSTSYMISPDANGNLLDDSRGTNYALSLGGLSLADPLQVGGQTCGEISNMVYNAGNNTISATINGQPATISGVVTPMVYDTAAPRRWWTVAQSDNNYPYWVTEEGFHINGVDDAQGLANLTGWLGFAVYWPEYGTAAGNLYDFLFPVTSITLPAATRFGAAYRAPNFSTPGKVIFPFLGTVKPGSIPASDVPIMTAFKTRFAIPEGYYLVQISDDETAPAYHMVSAADGLSWITWIR